MNKWEIWNDNKLFYFCVFLRGIKMRKKREQIITIMIDFKD